MEIKTENIEISYKIIDYLEGAASEKEVNEILDWMNSSQENKMLFNNVKSVWEADFSVHTDKQTEQQWKKFTSNSRSLKPLKNLKIIYSTAAAVALIIIISSFFAQYKEQNKVLNLAAKNSITEIYLPDKSFIVMNEGTDIQYKKSFGKRNRILSLEGEAFFQVKRDESNPFIVHFGNHQLKVLGTSFVIKSLPNENFQKVFVKEGLVEILINQNQIQKTVQLKKGDQIILNSQNNSWEIKKFSNENFLSWYSKNFIFDNTPLSQVAKTLSKAYDTTIITQDPSIDNLKLSASFEDQPIELIIEIVSRTFGLDVESKNDTILFTRKN